MFSGHCPANTVCKITALSGLLLRGLAGSGTPEAEAPCSSGRDFCPGCYRWARSLSAPLVAKGKLIAEQPG